MMAYRGTRRTGGRGGCCACSNGHVFDLESYLKSPGNEPEAPQWGPSMWPLKLWRGQSTEMYKWIAKLWNCKRSLHCLKPGQLSYGLDDRRSEFGSSLTDNLLFCLLPRMALGPVQPHIYCVADPPHRAVRSGGENGHTFPFCDDVNGWRCASTSLYVYQDKYLMLHIFCAVVQVSSTHQFYFQIPHKALCGIWKYKYGVYSTRKGLLYRHVVRICSICFAFVRPFT